MSRFSINGPLTATVFGYCGLLKDSEDPERPVKPDRVWFDLCLNIELVKARCMAFLGP